MNKRIYPLLAVLLGAAGFGLQCWAHTTAFEPLTGLIVPGTASMLEGLRRAHRRHGAAV